MTNPCPCGDTLTDISVTSPRKALLKPGATRTLRFHIPKCMHVTGISIQPDDFICVCSAYIEKDNRKHYTPHTPTRIKGTNKSRVRLNNYWTFPGLTMVVELKNTGDQETLTECIVLGRTASLHKDCPFSHQAESSGGCLFAL